MKRLVVIGVGAVILAACSSGGDAVPSTLPPATAAATSTLPTTTLPATTSTSTTSTTTSTTLAPTTTASTSTEDLIKQAVQDYITAYFACGQAPDQCDPSTFTASQGPSRSVITDLVTGMQAQGLHFSDDVRNSHLVAEGVDVLSQSEATAVYCAYDALIVLGPMGPDGKPTVVNDAISSIRYTYRLYLDGERWLVGEQEQLEDLGEGDLCPVM